MINKEIPFRPKLDGEFRARFYDSVSGILQGTSSVDIEDIASREIDWVENTCNYNLTQRKKYRAIWMLFRDLIRASWKAVYRDGVLYMCLPCLDAAGKTESLPESKKDLRRWMEDSRQEKLVSYTEFIQRMERKNSAGYSIEDLIADGKELAQRLEQVRNNNLSIDDVVKPYLQLVKDNLRDEYTNFKLSDIWRYFRLTWSNPSETTPGRTMQYLIRDAAHPMHAVMGIASLENTTVQISCRDDYIGWNQTAFIKNLEKLKKEGDFNRIHSEFNQLLEYISLGVSGINYSELCDQISIDNPTEEVIQQLLNRAITAEEKRKNSIKKSHNQGLKDDEKSKLGKISKETEDALYDRKRAEQLARLLTAKKYIAEVFNAGNFNEVCEDFWKSDIGNSSIRTALIAQKTQHIGSSMMELNVCGAIPPYNEILGGKLVALLATSPQIIHDYKERYQNSSSMIASLLKGSKVIRPADLVYIGTTSLYYVGSSQYNRLKIPASVFNSNFDIEWKKLGMTVGYGTMHISKATTLCLTEAINEKGNLFNHVFGEGASPKMRLLSSAIRELLESSGDETKELTMHAMSRIVYGVCLSDNTKEYLMGKDKVPNYYTDIDDYELGTQKIIEYWRNRWLASRLNYPPIYDRISKFSKRELLLSYQLNKERSITICDLGGKDSRMKRNDESKTGLQFIRGFYRGISAYADFQSKELLDNIHLKTRLDDAIIDDINACKDVVLTGNPGDGKTHIIRILYNQLNTKNRPVKVEIDASTLSIDEIYKNWNDAREQHVPYVIAINAAVFDSLYKAYPTFGPVNEAYNQMLNSVYFHNEQFISDTVVVYDLSKRDILTFDILKSCINKLTDDIHYADCLTCNLKDSCPVSLNRKILHQEIFQERLSIILRRVSLMGYHATLRELQSFIAYLIFGNRTCRSLNNTNGDSSYDIVNLIYNGKGTLFDKIREGLDPAKISHPVLDEQLLTNRIVDTTWIECFHTTLETIADDNTSLFELKKRQFFFLNEDGDQLLNILDDNVTQFENFINNDDLKIIKELIDDLNKFFGIENHNIKGLQIWSGHRYNNEPRKVLVSSGVMRKAEFSIGRPILIDSMRKGIDMMPKETLIKSSDSQFC